MNALILLMVTVFALMPLGIIGLVLFLIVRGVRGSRMRSAGLTGQPAVFSVPARILARRADPGLSPDMAPAAPAWFFVTFEFQNGERLELPVSGADYAQLVEGDYGTLTFAGRKYLGFARDLQAQPAPGPEAGFGGPEPGFGGPDAGFGGPESGFGGPDAGFGGPESGYDRPGAEFGDPNAGYEVPMQGTSVPGTDAGPASPENTENRVMTLPPDN